MRAQNLSPHTARPRYAIANLALQTQFRVRRRLYSFPPGTSNCLAMTRHKETSLGGLATLNGSTLATIERFAGGQENQVRAKGFEGSITSESSRSHKLGPGWHAHIHHGKLANISSTSLRLNGGALGPVTGSVTSLTGTGRFRGRAQFARSRYSHPTCPLRGC